MLHSAAANWVDCEGHWGLDSVKCYTVLQQTGWTAKDIGDWTVLSVTQCCSKLGGL